MVFYACLWFKSYLSFPIIDFTLNYTLDQYDDFQLAQLVNYFVVK